MKSGDGAGPLSGRRILVVEDEYYLAQDIAAALARGGAEIVGPAGTLGDAVALLGRGDFDGAVVDMNLRGDMAYPVADQLSEAGIPFIISTGYNSGSLPERFRAHPRIEKPFDADQIVRLLAEPAARR